MADPAYEQALVAALRAEDAAAYGYGVVGAHTSGASRSRARRALAWHQAQQVSLAARLVTAGGKAPLAEPGYVLPEAVSSAAAAVRLAATLETGVAAAYADLVAAARGADRLEASQALSSCAVWASQWSGRSQAFPGVPERA